MNIQERRLRNFETIKKRCLAELPNVHNAIAVLKANISKYPSLVSRSVSEDAFQKFLFGEISTPEDFIKFIKDMEMIDPDDIQ
jgi:hypothetical protein